MSDTHTKPEWRVVTADQATMDPPAAPEQPAPSAPAVLTSIPRQRRAEWAVAKPAPRHAAPAAVSAYVAVASAPRNQRKLLAIGGLLSLGVAGAGAIVLATTNTGVKSVALHGVFTINPMTSTFAGNFTPASDGSCTGYGSYSGLTAGAPVTIRDPQGRVLATSTLTAGKNEGVAGCEFSWQIPHVPKEQSYGVQISQLGIVKFSRSAITHGFNSAIGN